MATTRVILSHRWNTTNKKLSLTDGGNDSIDDHHLSDKIQKIARKELREDKTTREQCIQQLKEWLRKYENVENVRTDDKFLLRFLRAKKFSVPMAEQMLLKYLNLKRIFSDMATNLDFLSAPMNEIFSNGYCVVSPIRDQGRRVIIVRAANFDPHRWNSALQAKASFIALETLLEDPVNQVVGFTHVGDLQGITPAHVTNWNPQDFGRIIKWGEQSWPARHKLIHCVNIPQTVRWIVDFAITRVSSKIKNRFMTHTNYENLHKHIDPLCLPAEMGGKIPLAEMVELWKRELAEKRDLLIGLDKMKIIDDRDIQTKNQKHNNNPMQAHIESIAGSFRKLEVD